MMMMTSACANKMLRKLNEDKDFWQRKEKEGCIYVAAMDEDPVIPEYDFDQVSKTIEEIDKQILTIKHAINYANATSRIPVGENEYTIDEILIHMAQLNNRKNMYDRMRRLEPKKRLGCSNPYQRKTVVEYEYINFDLDKAKAEYERLDRLIAEMQMALDKYNQTVEFPVAL